MTQMLVTCLDFSGFNLQRALIYKGKTLEPSGMNRRDEI